MPDHTDLLTWGAVDRLLKARGRGARYQLAKSLGMNPSFLYRKLKTEDELTERQARAVRTFLDGGAAEPASFAPSGERSRIPVYGYVPPGQPDRVAYGDSKVLGYLEPPPWWNSSAGIIYVRMPGDGMYPRYFAGQIIPVKLDVPPAHGQDCVLELKDGTLLVRIYQGERDGHVWVQQFGAEPKTYGIPATELKAKHSVWVPGLI